MAAGADSIKYRQVGKADVVVGIAASGRTPFVWGALGEAKARGAKTVLLCLNPHLKVPKTDSPDVLIAPDIGPEILTGSTRLKSGTATKMILNMFTTLAMVRMGKVISNLMVDVTPTNEKLQDRATRIVCALTRLDYAAARQRLIDSDWEVQRALKAGGLTRPIFGAVLDRAHESPSFSGALNGQARPWYFLTAFGVPRFVRRGSVGSKSSRHGTDPLQRHEAAARAAA